MLQVVIKNRFFLVFAFNLPFFAFKLSTIIGQHKNCIIKLKKKKTAAVRVRERKFKHTPTKFSLYLASHETSHKI